MAGIDPGSLLLGGEESAQRCPGRPRFGIDSARVATRRSLHAVAETILAGHQHRVAGTIRLAIAEGGFRTLPLPDDPSLLTVLGSHLVVTSSTTDRTIPLRGSLQDLADAAGVTFGAPEGVYPGGERARGTDRVTVDDDAASALLAAFGLGDEALRVLGERHLPDEPPTPVLWPEHFDVGITLDRVNFGVSPGDDEIPEPYAYVGPFEPRRGTFWDRSFGAARTVSELVDVDAVVAFFEAGRTAAASDPARTSHA